MRAGRRVRKRRTSRRRPERPSPAPRATRGTSTRREPDRGRPVSGPRGHADRRRERCGRRFAGADSARPSHLRGLQVCARFPEGQACASGPERISDTTAQTPRPTAATPVAIASAASVGQDGLRGGSTSSGGSGTVAADGAEAMGARASSSIGSVGTSSTAVAFPMRSTIDPRADGAPEPGPAGR